MCSQVCAETKKNPFYWSNIYIHRECLTRSQFIGEYKNPQFLYNDDKTQCLMKSQDLGVLKDFQLKEMKSTDISEKKLSNTSPHLSFENNHNTSYHLSSDISVSCSQRQSHSCQNRRKILSHTDFMDVASKMSNACQQNKKYGTTVCAMMIEMLYLCKGKQISSLNVSSEGNMDKEFSSMIQNYKSSFKSITDVSVKEKNRYMPHKAVAYHHTSSKRLFPSVERIKKNI